MKTKEKQKIKQEEKMLRFLAEKHPAYTQRKQESPVRPNDISPQPQYEISGSNVSFIPEKNNPHIQASLSKLRKRFENTPN